jgi:predicted lipoprotein
MAANPPVHDTPRRRLPPAEDSTGTAVLRRRRLIVWALGVGAAVLLFSFAPLFHLVPLQDAREQVLLRAFDAGAFADQFWAGQLLPATDGAVDAAVFFNAVRQEPERARAQFGRGLGLSETWYGFVAVTGRVARVTTAEVDVATLESDAVPRFRIELGPVFGHAVRDGSGLLDVSDFPNSRDFNAVSSELNRRIEERVLPVLRAEAVPNAAIRVVGCVEVSGALTGSDPLPLVPILVEIP